MIHELFADQFSPRDPTSADKRRSVREADRVLCISQNTANDLMRLFGVPAEKIAVTYLGFSDVFTEPPPAGETSPHDRPYLLYVGHRGGYKNFRATLQAYADSPSLREQFDLVTFGGFLLGEEERLLAKSLGLAPTQLRRLAGSDADLARAYRHARVFVYPSLYEGFGIPPLEAMSAGCVVACADTSSIPEVVGDAAATFDPSDVGSIRRTMEQACFDEALRHRLVQGGRERVGAFSWDRCARDTVQAYRTTLGL
jgi:glycosyltransferase involved in cell wall biosynthesis